MRRLVLLLAGAALWLMLAALPALADGGPHVANANSGVSTLTADSCAGCHRAHTAEGAYLLTAPSVDELCLSCHGAASTGATTDVMTGVQYRPTGSGVRTSPATGTELGALRGGGFDQARIGDPFKIGLNNSGALAAKTKIQVGAPKDVTSSHIAIHQGLTLPGVAWGNGDNGTGAGPSVALECTSCHNPHGNGQYRILNPLPSLTLTSVNLTSVSASGVFTASAAHGLQVGDTVTVASVASGTSANGTWVVATVPSPTTFTVSGATAAGAGSGGTVARLSTSWSTAIFGVSSAGLYTTTSSHGLRVGDTVTVVGNSQPSANVVAKVVATVPASNTFTLTGVTVAAAGTGGVVARTSGVKVVDSPVDTNNSTKNYTVIQTPLTSAGPLYYASQVITLGVSATTGDYLRKQVPWNSTTSSGSTAYNIDAPNGIAVTANQATGASAVVGFNDQMNLWCASCHTRYFSYRNPDPTKTDGSVTNSYKAPRPGDSLFMYQHATRDSTPGCTTCHVAHGSDAVMDGAYSSTVPYPNDPTSTAVNTDSRLLKVGNRGMCQMCHDPTGTFAIGQQYPPAPYPTPTTP